MFPPPCALGRGRKRFPRVRGDVPDRDRCWFGFGRFSPRARGCSLHPRHFCFTKHRFPRVRGDVPRTGSLRRSCTRFSPRARGCSYFRGVNEILGVVFPACAGMFLSTIICTYHSFRFPRVRGDVPCPAIPRKRLQTFSPRARGCSRTDEALDGNA